MAIQKCLLNKCTGLPHKGTPTCYGLKPMQDRMPRCARNDGHIELISVSLGETLNKSIPVIASTQRA